MKNIKYQFNYDYYSAGADFTVDVDEFGEENARVLLDFFLWEYDTDGDPVDELMKKYALQAIRVATAEDLNVEGVREWFYNAEGFPPVDGTVGITLDSVEPYTFEESDLAMNKSLIES